MGEMKKLLRAFLIIAAAGVGSVICSTAPGIAQTDQQLQEMLKELGLTPKDLNKMAEKLGLDWCLFGTATYDWDQPIDSCTNAIKSGKYAGKALAGLFYQRAGAYYSNHEYDQAIRDYDEAIRLNPGFALALYERGFAKRTMGDNAAGSADIGRASELLPDLGRLPSDKNASNLTCQVRGGSFVLTDRDFQILAKDGMTKEKLALLPPTSKARRTVCETRKIARVVSGKRDDCALDPYKYWVVQYLDASEADKVLKVQISKAAATWGGEKPKCK
jgi:tetratricopeptide (TPR) repeat protein